MAPVPVVLITVSAEDAEFDDDSAADFANVSWKLALSTEAVCCDTRCRGDSELEVVDPEVTGLAEVPDFTVRTILGGDGEGTSGDVEGSVTDF